MKILLLSDLNSVHTQRWAHALAERGFELFVVGLRGLNKKTAYYDHPKIQTHFLLEELKDQSSLKSKLSYLKGVPKLKALIKKLNPDVVHAHYATSYGLLGALTKDKKPFFLSLWGDDVLIFPNQSFVHKQTLLFNLKKADRIFGTSQALVDASLRLIDKKVKMIPFGVDAKVFQPTAKNSSDRVIIGTIKALEDIYGVDILIKAFALLKKRYQEGPLSLLIVGGGCKEEYLKNLATELGIKNHVVFTGKVDHHEVPRYHHKIDIFAAFSRSESFGVSVVEAQASGVPAVVSDVGGLPEVVEDQKTGFVTPSENVEKAFEALEKLYLNSELRTEMGLKGRDRVLRLFDWNKNVDDMVQEYLKLKGGN